MANCAVTFKGGPADGQTLSFSRLPVFLRVVHNPTDFAVRKWDVLDQLEDEPEPAETISVYRGVDVAAPIFACRRGGSGSVAARVTYEFMPDVDGESVRDTDAWRAKVDDLAIALEADHG